ncbi:hypothetical protein BsWGS_09102 [Bradybaena similaris]
MKLDILLLLFAVDIIAAQDKNTTTTVATTTTASTPTTTTAETSTASTTITTTTAAPTTTTTPTTITTPTTTTKASTASTTITPTTPSTATKTSTASTPTTPSTATKTSTASTPTTPSTATKTSTVSTPTTPSTATKASTASTLTTPTTSGKSTPTSAAPTTGSSPQSSSRASTASASTASTAAPTTQQPSIKQNFTCQDGNTTKFSLTGSFALSITYNKTNAGSTTVPIEVPQTKQSNGTCGNSSTESLTFGFFNGWSITYIFQGVVSSENQLLSATDKYYISNITVVYVHDEHLPNSTTPQAKVESKFSQAGYLEANSDGYYTCQANISLKITGDLTLTTSDFKYKAFNDKGDINLDSGTVTECPSDESSSSIVPIAVGAALAGLVIIVLIAYLIGRKRSRKTGYENV